MARNQHELNNCIALMNRLEQYHPEIAELIVHCPNENIGRQRTDIGIKSGQPDYHLPVSSGQYNGLYIEMKRQSLKNVASGGLSIAQINRQKLLSRNDGYCRTCYSWQEALEVILEYWQA